MSRLATGSCKWVFLEVTRYLMIYVTSGICVQQYNLSLDIREHRYNHICIQCNQWSTYGFTAPLWEQRLSQQNLGWKLYIFLNIFFSTSTKKSQKHFQIMDFEKLRLRVCKCLICERSRNVALDRPEISQLNISIYIVTNCSWRRVGNRHYWEPLIKAAVYYWSSSASGLVLSSTNSELFKCC